jgi:hypothetical protein
VFIEETLQHAEELGKKYKDKPYNYDTPKALGIDEGFGSSKTASETYYIEPIILRKTVDCSLASSNALCV